jgi:hypothetical protein
VNRPKVSFTAKTDSGATSYHTDINIKSKDFKTYSLILTGTPVATYAWQISGQSLAHLSNVLYAEREN